MTLPEVISTTNGARVAIARRHLAWGTGKVGLLVVWELLRPSLSPGVVGKRFPVVQIMAAA